MAGQLPHGWAPTWNLEPDTAALSFTQGYLGFTGMDRLTSSTTANDAWVGVGFTLPDGRNATAAVLRLARFGTGADAPWEVVGTRDGTLILDTPRYGQSGHLADHRRRHDHWRRREPAVADSAGRRAAAAG
jgi:hypothetical protein